MEPSDLIIIILKYDRTYNTSNTILAHPAEANDAEVCKKIDSIIGLKPEPPAEEPGNASMREPHGKGAAKPRKKQQKRPRSFWHDGKQNIVK